MKKLARLSLVSVIALILPVFSGITTPYYAQRQGPVVQFPLLDNAVCRSISSDDRNLNISVFARGEQTVVIGRQIYESLFHTRSRGGSYTTLVCQADTSEFDTLSLRMGLADDAANSNEKITINIYQSGSVVSTYQDVQPGQMIEALVDLSSTSYASPGDIAVESICEQSSGYTGCFLHFIEAELSPTANYVSGNTNDDSRYTPSSESVSGDSEPGTGSAGRASSSSSGGGLLDSIEDTLDAISDIFN